MSNKVEYTTLGNSDIKVSKLCLGTWAMGGWMWGGTDDENAIKTIHLSLDQGINFIDTAAVYGFGHSEKLIGKALKSYGSREKAVIATKAGLEWTDNENVFRNSSKERIEKEIDDSLKRLQTDYIDLYQIHWPDTVTSFEEAALVMKSLLDKGKVRSIGVCNFTPEQTESFKKHCPLVSVQSSYNLFDQSINKNVRPYARKEGLSLLAYGSISRGLLSGKMSLDTKFKGDDLRKGDPMFNPPHFQEYLNAVDALEKFAKERFGKSILSLAVRWVIDQGAIPLWGAREPTEFDQVHEVFGWSLTDEDKKSINDIIDQTVTNPVKKEEGGGPPQKSD